MSDYPLLSWSDTGCGFQISLPEWFGKQKAAKVYGNDRFREYIEKEADRIVKGFYGRKAKLDVQWDEATGLQNVGFGGSQCCCTGIESSTLNEGSETPVYTHNIDSILQGAVLREVWMTYINGLDSLFAASSGLVV